MKYEADTATYNWLLKLSKAKFWSEIQVGISNYISDIDEQNPLASRDHKKS